MGLKLRKCEFLYEFLSKSGKKLGKSYSSQETWSLHQPNKGACQHHCCTHLELRINGLSHSQELNHHLLLSKVTSAAINSLGKKETTMV